MMKMVHVLVESIDWEGDEVLAVYDDEYTANEAARVLNRNNRFTGYHYNVRSKPLLTLSNDSEAK